MRKNRKKFAIKMPRNSNLGFMNNGTLWICQPLSPSQNELMGKHWGVFMDYVRQCHLVTLAQARSLLGRYERPWTDKARLSIYRCSDTNRRIDICNVIGGCKHAIDVLLDRRSQGFIGAGLIADDDTAHLALGEVKAISPREIADYPHLQGPGTWFAITPLK